MKNYNFNAIDSKLNFKSYNELKLFRLPEVCFTGRSNVGKSSLINAITNRKTVATTSNKPGHTKKIFMFTIDRKFILVDLPGYGYAKVSRKKTEEMSNLLYLYLTKRTFLKKAFILIDARRGIKEIDINFLEFLFKNKVPFQIVLTKIDKVSKLEEKKLLQGFSLHKLISNSVPIFTSAKTKIGIKNIRKNIISSII